MGTVIFGLAWLAFGGMQLAFKPLFVWLFAGPGRIGMYRTEESALRHYRGHMIGTFVIGLAFSVTGAGLLLTR